MLLYFIFGISIGFLTCQITYYFMEKIKNIKILKTHLKGWEVYLENTMDTFVFVYRVQDWIKIAHNDFNSHIIISISDVTKIYVYHNEEVILYYKPELEATIDDVRFRLLSHYINEINDVVVVNNQVYSRPYYESVSGIIIDQEPVVFNMDEILDKISIKGKDSLTKEELEFLNKQ